MKGMNFLRFSDYSRSRRNRKLRLGFNADENVHHVGGKTGYKIRELNFQEGDVAGVKP
jgi:hypothetical protein